MYVYYRLLKIIIEMMAMIMVVTIVVMMIKQLIDRTIVASFIIILFNLLLLFYSLTINSWNKQWFHSMIGLYLLLNHHHHHHQPTVVSEVRFVTTQTSLVNRMEKDLAVDEMIMIMMMTTTTYPCINTTMILYSRYLSIHTIIVIFINTHIQISKGQKTNVH